MMTDQAWPRTRLGSLVKVKHGFAFKGEFFVDEPTENILVTPGNFAIGGGFQLGKQKYYNGPIPPEYVLEPGSLVVTMTDLSKAADTLGYGAVVPRLKGVTFLHNQRIGLVEIRSQDVDKSFLHYLLRTHGYRQHIVGSASGSTVKHTSPSRIEDYQFDLPPMAIQVPIGEVLSCLDERITLLRETNATLEAIAQALFKSWFVDFAPVRARAEGREPEGVPPEVVDLFPDELVESELGMIPKGWDCVPFDQTVKVIGGGTPKTSVEEYWRGDIPWFSVVDAPAEGSVFVIRTEKQITESGLANCSSRLLTEGTTIISARGTVGKVALTGVPMAMNQSCYAFQGRNSDRYFTYYSTLRLVSALQQRAHGSVFSTITRDTLSGINVAWPSEEAIRAFELAVGSFMEGVKSNLHRAQTLTDLRDTLLPRLMSGKLRIAEAEKELEAV